MKKLTALIFSTILFSQVTLCAKGFADGVDIVSMLTLMPSGKSVLITVVWIGMALLLNYALNFLIIGFPLILKFKISFSSAGVGLIYLTLLGQIADRIGLFLGVVGLVATCWQCSSKILQVTSLMLYYGLASLPIALLSLGFLRGRWKINWLPSVVISLVAGVLTNPNWFLYFAGKILK